MLLQECHNTGANMSSGGTGGGSSASAHQRGRSNLQGQTAPVLMTTTNPDPTNAAFARGECVAAEHG
jgi:hypothetical protein